MRKGKGKSIHVLIDKRPRSSTKVTIDHDSSFFSTSYLSKENFVAAWNVMSAFLINFFVLKIKIIKMALVYIPAIK